jgi:lipopolysaccharide transport system permease protein
MLNPMSVPVESLRYVFLGAGTVDVSGMALSVGLTLLLLFSGLLVFQKVERTFVDTA